MERFGYTPALSITVPDIPGLSIRSIGLSELDDIRRMNRVIFNEERVINSFEKEDLMILEARLDDEPVGFKVGYKESKNVFYSAKGGVLEAHRRHGIALALLADMMRRVEENGFKVFAFDTFPNLHPGMTILAMQQGFHLVKADYNSVYKEFRLRFERRF
ncbi:MAG: GNAT family N-acetyltransferase [Bacteroidetes bacterium]|nr:GNAT family N-acetyltransferase [Bacteroidota bacterium]